MGGKPEATSHRVVSLWSGEHSHGEGDDFNEYVSQDSYLEEANKKFLPLEKSVSTFSHVHFFVNCSSSVFSD